LLKQWEGGNGIKPINNNNNNNNNNKKNNPTDPSSDASVSAADSESSGSCVLVFVDRQDAADRMYTDLMKAGYDCLALHGGMNQQDRDFTIDDFKRKVKNILVATSVAARGLDVKDLNLVINYDVPNHMEDYVHRVGRTGRAGNKGTAYTFITPSEDLYAVDIVKALELSSSPVPSDLKQLAEGFLEKRKTGQAVNVAGSGYGGKGFQFNEAEEKRKEEERRRQRKVYGTEDDQDEPEEESIDAFAEAGIDELSGAISMNGGMASSVSGSSSSGSSTSVGSLFGAGISSSTSASSLSSMTSSSQPSQQPHLETKVIADIPGIGVVTTQVPVKESVTSEALRQIRGALGINNTTTSNTSNSGGGSGSISSTFTGSSGTGLVSTDRKDSNALAKEAIKIADKLIRQAQQKTTNGVEHFYEELEINDYPQQARWKVTHKDSLAAITEFTNTAITTRGTYVPPGKQVLAPGERRLYLVIEGDEMANVKKARSEILRILEETTLLVAPDKVVKYKVV